MKPHVLFRVYFTTFALIKRVKLNLSYCKVCRNTINALVNVSARLGGIGDDKSRRQASEQRVRPPLSVSFSSPQHPVPVLPFHFPVLAPYPASSSLTSPSIFPR